MLTFGVIIWLQARGQHTKNVTHYGYLSAPGSLSKQTRS